MPGTYMLCFFDAPQEAQSAPGTNIKMIIVAVLFSVFALASLAGVRFGFTFVKSAISNRTANDANKRKRVREAVRSVTTMQSACWLITLDNFRGLGKMVSHEHARDANLLRAVDDSCSSERQLFGVDQQMDHATTSQGASLDDSLNEPACDQKNVASVQQAPATSENDEMRVRAADTLDVSCCSRTDYVS